MKKQNDKNRRDFIKKSLLFSAGTFVAFPACSKDALSMPPAKEQGIKYLTVAALKDRFFGWPANNGMWQWDNGREILLGFTNGNFEEQDGHNIGKEQLTNLARSTDGGETWEREDPENFVGDEGEVIPSPGNILFGHPDFALRVAARGYHGTNDKNGHFFISYSRGKNWEGPYRFNGLNEDENLEGMEITSRTNYRISGDNSIQLFMTARNRELEFGNRLDKPFIAESNDGGKSFQFKGWAVPWTDQYRAVMPSVVHCTNGDLVMSVRRRNPRDKEQSCWVDAFVSKDEGGTWSFLSKIGDTGLNNGNPPGLAILKDGRLACCYANRTSSKIFLRFSENNGASWEEEIVVRDNPYSYDMGYPQLLQNSDGDLVALYYISTEECPQSYIEAAIISGF